jgi:exopolysaccharide biosynthesis polyprenyl glycosylphosphotransferase
MSGVFLGIVMSPIVGPASNGLVDLLALRVSLGNVLIAAVCVTSWRTILMGMGVYTPSRTRSLADYIFRCIMGLNACAGVVGLVEVARHQSSTAWQTVALFWTTNLLLLGTARILLFSFDHLLRPALRRTRNLIIVGSGERARRVFEELKGHHEWDYRLVGYVDSDPQASYVPAEMILGGMESLEEILMHMVVDEVVIALPMKSQYETVGQAIGVCQMLGVQSQYFTDHFGNSVTKRRSSTGSDGSRMVLEVVTHDYRLHLKRMLDLGLGSLGILVLSPLFLATALAVKLTSPGPMMFRQKRIGLNKRSFSMLKFRSMCIDAEARQAAVEHLNEIKGPTFKIKNDPRLTPIGNFIRRLSLDELPQLFNVVAGDMSLVGPRPLPLRDVERFSEAWLMRRFSVKPGVTCLWQIMGRSNTDFERWMELDLQYIDNWSLSLDFMILLKTIPAVVTSRGAV